MNYPYKTTMSKITNTDIKNLQFDKAMFGYESDASGFDTFIDQVIADIAPIFEGRVGAANYASTTKPTSDYVKRGELCMVAAEMCQRRINIMLNNAVANGQEIDVSPVGTQKKIYNNEANNWIANIVAGKTNDNVSLVSSVIESDHFTVAT